VRYRRVFGLAPLDGVAARKQEPGSSVGVAGAVKSPEVK
jgi:hypothetical protein